MSFQYRYTGDNQVVFVSLRKDGETWAPNRGDTIGSDVPIAHPLLELIVDTPVVDAPVVDVPAHETSVKVTVPALPEIKSKPSPFDESEEN